MKPRIRSSGDGLWLISFYLHGRVPIVLWAASWQDAISDLCREYRLGTVAR